MAGEITWGQANFTLNSNGFTWDDVKIVRRAAGEDCHEPHAGHGSAQRRCDARRAGS